VDPHRNPLPLHGFAEGQVEEHHHIHHDTKILPLTFKGNYVRFFLVWLAVSIAIGILVGVKTHGVTAGFWVFSGVFLPITAGVVFIGLLIKPQEMREVAKGLPAPALVP